MRSILGLCSRADELERLTGTWSEIAECVDSWRTSGIARTMPPPFPFLAEAKRNLLKRGEPTRGRHSMMS